MTAETNAPAAEVASAGGASSFLLKQAFEEQAFPRHEICGLTFDVLSAQEMAKYAEVRIVNSDMYFPMSGNPVPHGVLDLHLGANRAERGDKNRCLTCGGGWEDCCGHWGNTELASPVFHVGYYKHLLMILYCICKQCGRLLLSDEEKKAFLQRMRRNRTDTIVKKVIFKRIVDACKKVDTCSYCEAPQGAVRKIVKPALESFLKIYHTAKLKDVSGRVTTVTDELNPGYVHDLLAKIPGPDLEVLDITRPEKFILTSFPVPPSSIRPSVTIGDMGTNEDDLTCCMATIVGLSNEIKAQRAAGVSTEQILKNEELLQLHAVRYINTDFPQCAALLAQNSISKPGRGVSQRLKGKEGRFRGNLSGKRVDFSGRTVISPDPNCAVSEVVVPMWSARRLTFREHVSPYNIAILRKAVLNGPDEWPGALNVIKKNDPNRLTSLRFSNRRQAAEGLEFGDIVERHCFNGDIVLFNRQPSLHRMSIMAHRARVMPWRTLRFNECVCSPYNADFDGDEMNCHLPQTQEARAEAYHLMGVVNNLVTPKNGEPLVACTQDFLSGSYMICHKDVFLPRDKFCLYCSWFMDGMCQIDLPTPAILKPCELWTGKQLINVLLRPNKDSKLILNFELREREFEKVPKGVPEFMCRRDGYVLFHRGELMCGAIAKKVLGGGSKEGLFYYMIRDNSPQQAAVCMGRFAKLTGRWFANRGMTIGIDDVTPTQALTDAKNEIVARGFEEVQAKIELFDAGRMQPAPGCTVAQTLESQSSGLLSNIREEAGKIAQSHLHPLNKPYIMFLSGAKGSVINIAQMIACVGQQVVSGRRVWDGFVKRSLPHYTHKEARGSRARGFVANSFYTGLEPDEFFFHAMGGRDGLVDAAVKTAETGYMQRRIVKALEDLSVKYDRSVRTSDGQIVQFVYGDDGLNPIHVETKKVLMDLDKLAVHIGSIVRIDPNNLDDANVIRLANKRKIRSSRAETIKKRKRDFLARSLMSNLQTEEEPSADEPTESSLLGSSSEDVKVTVNPFFDNPSILPPEDDSALTPFLLNHVRVVAETAKKGLPVCGRALLAGSGLPRSLRQKLQLLRASVKRDFYADATATQLEKLLKNVSPESPVSSSITDVVDDEEETAEMSTSEEIRRIGDLILRAKASTDKTEDGLTERVRENLRAHLAVYDWLSVSKQHAPLVPYEIEKWSDYLIGRLEESTPMALKKAQETAMGVSATHQKATEQVKLFTAVLRNWFKTKVESAAKLREREGDMPMRTKDEYETGLSIFKRQVLAFEQRRKAEVEAGETLEPLPPMGILQRRMWLMAPSALMETDLKLGDDNDFLVENASLESRRAGFLKAKLRATRLKRLRLSRQDWISVQHLLEMIRLAWRKYTRALIEPGEAVGAIGAQSIGEPGTQMTLKTFHFAGVASMSVSLGVPRIKEIINAATNIQTPIIEAPLSRNQKELAFATMLKAKIEKTYLGEVCRYVKQVFAPEGTWIVVRLAKGAIQRLYLDVTADSVRESILEQGTINKVKLREGLVEVVNDWKLIVRPPGGDGMNFQCRALMDGLRNVRVAGLPNVKRSVIQAVEEKTKDGKELKGYVIATEGIGLQEIMAVNGLEGTKTMSNNVMEVKSVLGIEAARQTIINEIRKCMDAYSMDIDLRHMQLLGDVMTFRGEVLGISRHGIQKMRASVLCLASFEETNEHIFEAAVHRKSEHVQGVSEAIILGQRVCLGTGAFELLYAPPGMPSTGATLPLAKIMEGRTRWLLSRHFTKDVKRKLAAVTAQPQPSESESVTVSKEMTPNQMMTPPSDDAPEDDIFEKPVPMEEDASPSNGGDNGGGPSSQNSIELFSDEDHHPPRSTPVRPLAKRSKRSATKNVEETTPKDSPVLKTAMRKTVASKSRAKKSVNFDL